MSRLSERIENFKKSFEIYKSAVQEFDNNKILTHMALVQSYEICFELSWKVLKDYLCEQGIEVNFPKEVIKEAFNKGAIKDGQLWIDMLIARNATSHEYNMEKINKYLQEMTNAYYQELVKFQSWTEDISE